MRHAFLVIALVFFFSGAAFGEAPPSPGETGPSAGEETEDFRLDTVNVTATKKAEDLQEVPAGVTVFNHMDLEDMRIDSVSDIARFTPNFHNFDTGIMGLYTPSIRGKSGESSGSSVGLYVDGIPVLSGTGFNDVLLDIERVEVLKGPQGTLYGKNTQVGAVNIISKPPEETFSAKVIGEAALGQTYKTSATFNIPVIEDLVQMRVSGLHYERDGYLKYVSSGNDLDHRNYNYGKINVRVTPSDPFEINLIASALAHDDGGVNMNITDRYAAMVGLPKPDPDKVASNLEGWNKSTSNMQVLKMGWDITSAWRLESVTSRRMYRSHYLNDWDFSSLDLMHKEMDSTELLYSQEVRGGYTGEYLDFMTGIYMDKGENKFKETNDITGLVDEEHTTRTNSLGLFVNADLDITPKVTFSTGLRYDKDEGEYDEPSRSRNIRESWEEISPRFALSYTPVQGIMVYASAAKGYLSGGFNDHAGPTHPTSYDQETLWSYETGVKTRLLDERLQLNCAVFHMDIKDYQVRIDAGPSYNYTVNAAKAESSGFEVETRARVTEMLTLTAGFGYTRAVFKEYQDASGDYKGNKLPYAPEYSGSMGAIFRHPEGFYAGVDITGYGETFLNKENQFPRDPYAVVDAKVGYEAESFDLYVFADNLFDEDYSAEGYFGGMYRVASPPRKVGLALTYRF